MRKKLVALIIATSCCLSLAGCNAVRNGMQAAKEESEVSVEVESSIQESTEESTEASTEESTTESTEAPVEESSQEVKEDVMSSEAPTELTDNLLDFRVSVDGVIYQIPMWFSDFEALGWEFKEDPTTVLNMNEYATTLVWEKDGVEVFTQLANFAMNPKPFNECVVVGLTFPESRMENCDWEILLPGGIQYGVSTMDEILAAYGTPDYEYDGTYHSKVSYEAGVYESVDLAVYKDTNTLREIKIQNLVELEGSDNSVDTTVPDVVSQYKAPTELGDDLYSFNAEIDGKCYTFPCPVQEFLKNGFTIDKDDSDAAVAANKFGWVELSNGKESYSAQIANYAEYATIPENCFVTEFEGADYYDFEFRIPCDIKVGDKETDLLKKLEPFEYTTDTSGDKTYYLISKPDDESYNFNRYQIAVEDGVITWINVQNEDLPY